MRERIQKGVEIDFIGFAPEGIVLIAHRWSEQSLIIPLCDGLIGEFKRISSMAPVFSLQQVRQASDQDRSQSVAVLNALWRRPEFPAVDQAISAFLPLVHQNSVSGKQALSGVDRHES